MQMMSESDLILFSTVTNRKSHMQIITATGTITTQLFDRALEKSFVRRPRSATVQTHLSYRSSQLRTQKTSHTLSLWVTVQHHCATHCTSCLLNVKKALLRE